MNPVIRSLLQNFLTTEKWVQNGWSNLPPSNLEAALTTGSVRGILCWPRSNTCEVYHLNSDNVVDTYVVRFRLPAGIEHTSQNLVQSVQDILNITKPGGTTDIVFRGTYFGWVV